MGDKEKRIIKAVADALPNMSEFDKGYMLGVAESNKDPNKGKEEKNAEEV